MVLFHTSHWENISPDDIRKIITDCWYWPAHFPHPAYENSERIVMSTDRHIITFTKKNTSSLSNTYRAKKKCQKLFDGTKTFVVCIYEHFCWKIYDINACTCTTLLQKILFHSLAIVQIKTRACELLIDWQTYMNTWWNQFMRSEFTKMSLLGVKTKKIPHFSYKKTYATNRRCKISRRHLRRDEYFTLQKFYLFYAASQCEPR